MRRGLVFVLVAAVAAAWPAAANARSEAKKIGRPSYTVRQATPLETPYVVVHYVRSSRDAPRLKDDDRDQVPNYIEKVANVANISFRFYGKNGFKAPLPDSAGGNPKIDIYVKRLPPGVYGYVVAPAFTTRGTYMVIDSRLNMAHVTTGSLQQTVAHEMFHIFQYSYLPSGRMPAWVAEGSAVAMETFTYPKIYDTFRIQAVDYWLNTPHRSLYDERQSCLRCYGGALWWRFVFSMGNKMMQEYFGRLYGYEKAGRPVLNGLQPLDEIMQKRGQGSLYAAFSRFAYNVYRAGYRPKPLYVLRAQSQVQRTPVRVVQGLSTHYIPVKVPAGARGLALGTVAGLGPAPNVKLVVGGPKGRVIPGELRGRGYERFFGVTFNNARERDNVMLIITSGREQGAAYAVGFASA